MGDRKKMISDNEDRVKGSIYPEEEREIRLWKTSTVLVNCGGMSHSLICATAAK